MILGEFLEEQFKKHFDLLRKKQKELGINLPPYPKPIFIGSTKQLHSMKTTPGSKAGDNVLLIQFENATISNYTFETIECSLHFNIYINTKHLVTLTDITDVIMSLHNAPLNIVGHENLFTTKGYMNPDIYVLNARVISIINLNQLDEKTQVDRFKFLINTVFDVKIGCTPSFKIKS